MGSVCCVAARDKTIGNGSGSENLHWNIRHSPNWSFRWDNRGRVAGEETSINWLSDRVSQNDRSEVKYESAYSSEEGSPLEHFRQCTWRKSSASEGTTVHVKASVPGQSISRNVSMDASSEPVKATTVSPTALLASPMKQSLSLASTSSLSTSPLSSQSLVPTTSSVPMWSNRSPTHQFLRRVSGRVSDSQTPEFKSPNSFAVSEDRQGLPSLGNESVRGSQEGSSDGWSVHAFSELMASSQRGRWSFDSESFGFNREKIARSGNLFAASSPHVDLQTCGVCSKLLIEKSLWSSQKIIISNELSVVSVLTCGHVYHAECLEKITPEVNKYDPGCPVCTFGEKETLKLSEKVLKAEIELNDRNRRSRNRIVDGDLGRKSIALDPSKSIGHQRKGPTILSSFSTRGSLGKTFLKRHFSFGSNGHRISSENNPPAKKGFFWTKSCKV